MEMMMKSNRLKLILFMVVIMILGSVMISISTTNVKAASVDLIEDTGVSIGSNGAAFWSPIVHYNNATYMTYTASDQTARVAKRDASGNYTETIVASNIDYDLGHTQSSLVIDGDGYIHVFYGMHYAGNMKYSRSNQPESVSGGFTSRSSEFPGGANYTYPNLTTAPNGDVYLGIRNYHYLELHRWNNSTNNWSKIANFANTQGYYAYVPNLTPDSEGNIHISFEWALSIPRDNRHLGSYALYKPSTGKFYKANGTQYTLPITTTTADIFQPMESGEIWSNHPINDNDQGIQGSTITVDDNDNPLIAYRYSPNYKPSGYTVRFAKWNGSGWERSQIYQSPNEQVPYKPWITYSNSEIRIYAGTGYDFDIMMWGSTDAGNNWSLEEITSGDLSQNATGYHDSVTGKDYLYITNVGSGKLHYGIIDPGGTYQPPVGNSINLAPLANTITVDSTNGNNTKDKAVDGSKNNNASRWMSEDTEPHFYQMDWNTTKTISNVKVWSGNMSQAGWQILDYEIEYWDNGAWQTAAAVSNNSLDGYSGDYNDLNFATITTNKIRMTITDAGSYTGNTKARLLEIEVWGTDESQINLAPSATLTVDSTDGTNTKDKAVDGIKNNNTSRWASESVEPHYFQLAWDSNKTIDNVKVWSGNLSQAGWQISDYTIEYWDGGTWQLAETVSGNTEDGYNGAYNDLTFSAVTTDKLRMNITDACAYPGNTKARLFEIEVWGN